MGYASGVGREAPPFLLKDVQGNEISLAGYRGDWYVVVALLPARDGINESLAALDATTEELWGLRAQIVGVVVGDPADVDSRTKTADRVAFPVLADDGTLARMYGIGRAGSAHKTVVIIDRAGKIVHTADDAHCLVAEKLTSELRRVVR